LAIHSKVETAGSSRHLPRLRGKPDRIAEHVLSHIDKVKEIVSNDKDFDKKPLKRKFD